MPTRRRRSPRSSTSSTSTTPARPSSARRPMDARPRRRVSGDVPLDDGGDQELRSDLYPGRQTPTSPVLLAGLPDGRYLISVLADGYKLDGTHFTMPLTALSQSSCSRRQTPIRCSRPTVFPTPRSRRRSSKTSHRPTAPPTCRPSTASPVSRAASTTTSAR